MRSIERVSGMIGSASAITSARLAMFLAKSPVRSRLQLILSAATVRRRSWATGWRSAIVLIVLRSMSRCMSSSRSSRPISVCARKGSRSTTARTASATCCSARPPMRATSALSWFSSSPKNFSVCSFMTM